MQNEYNFGKRDQSGQTVDSASCKVHDKGSCKCFTEIYILTWGSQVSETRTLWTPISLISKKRSAQTHISVTVCQLPNLTSSWLLYSHFPLPICSPSYYLVFTYWPLLKSPDRGSALCEMLLYQLLLSLFLICATAYDWRDGQLPLERIHIVESGGTVKNSETKVSRWKLSQDHCHFQTDHHVPTNANFPRQNYYHYRTKWMCLSHINFAFHCIILYNWVSVVFSKQNLKIIFSTDNLSTSSSQLPPINSSVHTYPFLVFNTSQISSDLVFKSSKQRYRIQRTGEKSRKDWDVWSFRKFNPGAKTQNIWIWRHRNEIDLIPENTTALVLIEFWRKNLSVKRFLKLLVYPREQMYSRCHEATVSPVGSTCLWVNRCWSVTAEFLGSFAYFPHFSLFRLTISQSTDTIYSRETIPIRSRTDRCFLCIDESVRDTWRVDISSASRHVSDADEHCGQRWGQHHLRRLHSRLVSDHFSRRGGAFRSGNSFYGNSTNSWLMINFKAFRPF